MILLTNKQTMSEGDNPFFVNDFSILRTRSKFKENFFSTYFAWEGTKFEIRRCQTILVAEELEPHIYENVMSIIIDKFPSPLVFSLLPRCNFSYLCEHAHGKFILLNTLVPQGAK